MKTYIFDLDGVVLDSLDVWEKIDKAFLKNRGIRLPNDYIDTVNKMGFAETANYTINRFNLTDTPDALMKEWDNMAVFAYGNLVPLKAGAKQYLHKLHKEGATLAVATSLPKKLYEPALKKHGIENLFKVICGKEEITCSKSRPDIFLLVAKKLGVKPSDCTVFEDILPAIKSAKSIGMTTYGVYNSANKSDWGEIKQTADYTIKTFEELLKYNKRISI